MAATDIKDFPQLAQYNLFTDSLAVPNVAFNATTWNNANGVPTKNAIRDEIIRYRLLSNHDSLSTLDERSYNSLTDKPTIPSITPANVTAGSNKITFGGTPTGAALQPFSIDVDQTKIDHNSLLNYKATKHFYQSAIDSINPSLATGLLKVTTGTGKLSVATAGTDYITTTQLGAKLDTTSATYADRLHWGLGYSHSTTVTGSIHGSSTVGESFFRLTNPSAITFPRINANNTVSALSASDFRTAIGAEQVPQQGL
jgi:hypothetical protein